MCKNGTYCADLGLAAEPFGCRQMIARASGVPFRVEHLRERVVRGGQIGLQLDRPRQRRGRALPVLFRLQHRAKCEVRVGVARFRMPPLGTPT